MRALHPTIRLFENRRAGTFDPDDLKDFECRGYHIPSLLLQMPFGISTCQKRKEFPASMTESFRQRLRRRLFSQ